MLGAEQKAAGAGGRVDDALTGFGVEQFDHETDQMARGAELAILPCRSHFAEQVLEGVAHDVLRGGTAAGTGEKLVDGINGIGQHLALVGIELEVGIGHAVVEARELGAYGAGAGEVFVQFA